MTTQPTIIVTGGAQGIGRGITTWLLDHHYRVVAVDIDQEAGEECQNAYQGQAFRFTALDVSDERAVKALYADSQYRNETLLGLVNCAGIANPHSGPVEELPLATWQRILDVNLTGTLLMCQHGIPYLAPQQGAIVNIASSRALQSEPNTEAYAASKGGIVALSHALAISLAGRIRVNCVSPGWIAVSDYQKAARRKAPELRDIDHRQHPVGRVGRPADVAAAVGYLLSPAAGFVSGQNLVVDGGMTRKMIYSE